MCIQGEERRRRQSVLVGSKGSGLTLDYGKPANCQRGMNDKCARSGFFSPPKKWKHGLLCKTPNFKCC